MVLCIHRGALRRGAVLFLVGSSLVLNGCATSGYTVAANDPCGAQRAELKSVEDSYVEGAMIGALGGALGGALIGGLISGDHKGALIGAGAGALAGGIGGYFVAKQNATSDRGSLVSSIYGDVAAENAKLDRVSTAFRQIRACRMHSADEVKTAYAARKLARPDAEARLQRIRQLFTEDIQVAEALGAKMNERGEEFQFASNELLKQDPVAQQEVRRIRAAAAPVPTAKPQPPRSAQRPTPQQRKPQPQAVAAAPQAAPNTTTGVVTLTESNQVKRQAFASDVQQAKVEAATAFELEGRISRLPAGIGLSG